MSTVDRVTELVLPVVEPLELDLYDVELNGGTLRITVERNGGVTLDALADATRAISRVLDEHDPMPGKYTLEVSSPGVERRLRTPAHFEGAVGEEITVKLGPHVEGDRRVRGVLQSAGDDLVVATENGEVTLALADVTRANTVFEWGPAPKPGSPEARRKKRSDASSDAERKAAAQ